MPPSKGRMQGSQASRMSGPRLAQPKLAFKAAKHLSTSETCVKSAAPSFKSGNFKDLQHTEQLKKLRIPEKICRSLPSVRRYANSKGYIDTTDSKRGEISANQNTSCKGDILGVRKNRGMKNRYRIHQIAEKKFTGMIWNVTFLPGSETDQEIIVSNGSGTYICDLDLNVKVTLENIKLPGGVAVLSDHRIVAVCRFFDMINIYASTGSLLSSFSGGESPMNVAVNSMDEIIVTDVGAKCLRMFRPDGSPLRVIAQVGMGYHLKWPLYLSVMTDDQILVCDCHQQQLLLFDFRGNYIRTIPLKTTPSNEVLRPHGVCTTEDNDFFIIDNATDTVEVFTKEGHYLQNLIPGDIGGLLKPKVLHISSDSSHMAVGGMSGSVCLFRFLEEGESELHFSMKTDVKSENQSQDDVLIIDLDAEEAAGVNQVTSDPSCQSADVVSLSDEDLPFIGGLSTQLHHIPKFESEGDIIVLD